jgi:hypothetical protein
MTDETPGGWLDRVLNYVDKPWKVASIAALALIGLVSVTSWERRADIASAILHSTVVPRLEPGRFKAVVSPLMDETGADVGILLAVQLNNNVARIVAGIRRDDPNWVPSSGPRPVFYGNDPAVVVQLISGTTACSSVTQASPSETAREMWSLGITRVCVVSVPAVVDVLVGALGIGWKSARNAQAEEGAKTELRRSANKLATW